MEPKIIYLVYADEYSDRHLVASFTEQQRAKDFVTAKQRQDHWVWNHDHWEIDTIVLDLHTARNA